ncbi:OmpA family protein [Pedobacter sp. BS3]|uniref:OmpA family protein n=1 Tax=Pedobacter sp. BS3 TaxID=2567937 RepID=UPI0011EC791B|nr:OmpA family protein [Pedobacter sp. BS3]TZF84986.1 OmpA family protein [Pedobacter sp. BS3]
MKLIFKIFLLQFCVLCLQQQKSFGADDPRMKKAAAAYQSFQYLAVIQLLNPIVQKDTANTLALEMLADSYRKIRMYNEALASYEALSKKQPLKPVWALRYAEALANNERYEESEQWYRKYLAMVPADKRASSFVKTDPSVFSKDKGEWTVDPVSFNTGVSEYSPIYYKDGLLFVSNRTTKGPTKNVFLWDLTAFSDLYVVDNMNGGAGNTSSKDNKKAGKLVYNDDDTAPTSNDNNTFIQYGSEYIKGVSGTAGAGGAHLLSGKVNTRYHEGPAVIAPDGTLIFTRNNYSKGVVRSGDGTVKLKLYFTDGSNWDHITEFPYNSNEYSIGHPAISKDGNILIFTSDMPGGFGGTDLYYSVRNGAGGQWGRPVNMGNRINTEGDEMFPYLDKDGLLFFASTGYAGLGGLDLFEVALNDLKPQYTPRNLGVPFNSSKDDFGFIKSADGRSGYFSSNRNGSDDIFSYKRIGYRVNLEGLVVDAKTNLPLSSTVYLRHNGEVDTLKANSRGMFTATLAKATDYEIIADRPSYMQARTFITTNGIKVDSTIKVTLKLRKMEASQQWVMNNCDSLKRQFWIPNIYYDLDKDFIRDDAKPVLDRLVQLMKAHPELTVITSSHCDSRASAEYNKDLSMRRGESAKRYLVEKGIAEYRITVEYYGKSRLVNRCYDGVPCSEADQQLNRRTEFDILMNDVNLSQIECK